MENDHQNLKILQDSLRQLHETEEIAKSTAIQLAAQRNKISNVVANTKQSNDDLSQSRKLVSRMHKREICIIL